MKKIKISLSDVKVLVKEVVQERLNHYNSLTNDNEPGTPSQGDLRSHTIYGYLFSLPLLLEKTSANIFENPSFDALSESTESQNIIT